MAAKNTQDDPEVEFIDEVGGFYFRSILLRNRGDTVAQHSHDHDHVTYIGNGSVLAFAGGGYIGRFDAGRAVFIEAYKPHRFVALEDNTRLTCVHNVASAEAIKGRGL